MKAGCSIVDKPEGGGGEQKLIISDVPGMSLRGSFSLPSGSVHRCQTGTRQTLTGQALPAQCGLVSYECSMYVTCLVPALYPGLQSLLPIEAQFHPVGGGGVVKGFSAVFS